MLEVHRKRGLSNLRREWGSVSASALLQLTVVRWSFGRTAPARAGAALASLLLPSSAMGEPGSLGHV